MPQTKESPAQAEQKKIPSRIIIPPDEYNGNYAWGFIGSIKDFQAFLLAQRRLLQAGILSP